MDIGLFAFGEGDRGVEIAFDLFVRNLRDDREDILEIRDLRDVALPGVEFRRDGVIAGLGQTAAEILDMLMDAEDFMHDQDDRGVTSLGRHGAVGRDRPVGHGNLDLAGGEAVGIGGYGGGRDRADGGGEAGGQGRYGEAAAA